jgi:RimJ/RimL family protein N-acetyltransferase
MHAHNSLGQAVGPALPNWKVPALPSREASSGHFCSLEPLSVVTHGRGLFEANALDREARNWTYLPYGPFADFASYEVWLQEMSVATDRMTFAIVDVASGKAVGVCAYLRIAPESGSIEVGHLNYAPPLQKRPAATEAMFLMMKRVFALGYRRYEWKCDALNEASRRSALRLGFTFEGIFRQAMVYKGRSRDTAWYSVLDHEWPGLERAFLEWLAPNNFEAGRQRTSLSELIAWSREG